MLPKGGHKKPAIVLKRRGSRGALKGHLLEGEVLGKGKAGSLVED